MLGTGEASAPSHKAQSGIVDRRNGIKQNLIPIFAAYPAGVWKLQNASLAGQENTKDTSLLLFLSSFRSLSHCICKIFTKMWYMNM